MFLIGVFSKETKKHGVQSIGIKVGLRIYQHKLVIFMPFRVVIQLSRREKKFLSEREQSKIYCSKMKHILTFISDKNCVENMNIC